MGNKAALYKILFLHHSTGEAIMWAGETPTFLERKVLRKRSFVSGWFKAYNAENNANFVFQDQYFPKSQPYGWNNYPYDYYSIWVKNAGDKPYKQEPTLEMLTKEYNLIIFKHCYPVCDIVESTAAAEVDSNVKSIENYQLQYEALGRKLSEFQNTQFLLWTGAARVASAITKEQAERAKLFFDWVKYDWSTQFRNVFIFDFYELETEGSLYLKNENARSKNNSHPGKQFARKSAEIFCKRIIEVAKQNF